MPNNRSLQNPNFKRMAYKNYWLQVQLSIDDIMVVHICVHSLAQVFPHLIWYRYPLCRDKSSGGIQPSEQGKTTYPTC